jgi:hypothetical protein
MVRQQCSGDGIVKALETWRQQELTPLSRAALCELIEAQRSDPDDHATRDALLDCFMETLTEGQLVVFSRLLRELTELIH